MSTTPTPTPNATTRPRKWPLRIAGGLVGALGLGVVFAPTIASSLAPGIIAQQAGKALHGSASVKSASLSWRGPQTLEDLVVLDAKGTEVARATIRADKGLLGLATGGLDVGEVTITKAKVALVRDTQGTLNLASLVKQSPSPQPTSSDQAASKPITLPKGLKVKLTIDSLDATLTDFSTAAANQTSTPSTLTLSNLTLSALIDASKPLDISLSADATSSAAPSASPTASPASQPVKGSLALTLNATNWASPSAAGDSTLSLDTAQAKGSLALTSFPVALADALTGGLIKDAKGATTPLASVLGESLAANLRFEGSLQAATASLSARTAHLDATGAASLAQGSLTQQGPLSVRVASPALQRLAPALAPQLVSGEGPTTLTSFPDATLTLTNLALTLPKDGAPLDLRTAAGTLALALSQSQGVVQLPGQPAQTLVIAPLSATLAATPLAENSSTQHLTLQASTSATLNGANAGTLSLSASLANPLDASGKLALPSTGIPAGLDATLRVQEVATVIAQPFVQSLGLDLARDVGPTLSTLITATSSPDNTAQASSEQASPQQAIPNQAHSGQGTQLALSLDASAAQLAAKGTLLASPTRITSTGEGFTLTLRSAGTLLGALTAQHPSLRVSGQAAGGQVGTASLTIPFFDIALAQGTPALHQSQVQATLKASNLALSSPNSPAGPVQLTSFEGTTLLFMGGRVETGGVGTLSHEGSAFGVGYDIKAPGLLVAPQAGKAFALADIWSLRPTGTIELGGLPTSLLRMLPTAPTPANTPANTQANTPAANAQSLDLASLLREAAGPQLTLRSTFAPQAPAPQGSSPQTTAATSPQSSIAITTTLVSDRLKGDVRALASDTQVLLQLAKIDLSLAPPTFAEVLRQFAPTLDPRPQLLSQATATLTLDPIALPLSSTKSPQLDKAGLLKGRLSVPDAIVVGNLAKPPAGAAPTPGASQSPQAQAQAPQAQAPQLERVGVRGLSLEFEAPLASLLAPSPGTATTPGATTSGEAKATLRGGFLGAVAGQSSAGAVRDMGSMQGSATATLSAGKPGAIVANFSLESVPASVLGALSNQPTLVPAALGGDVALTSRVSITPGATPGFASSTLDAQATLTAQNLTMQPLALRVTPTEITLAQPSTIELWTTPQLAAEFLKPAPDGTPPAFTLAQATTTRITLTQLRLPRTAGTTPAESPAGSPAGSPATRPTLLAQATIALPGMNLRTRDSKSLQLGEVSVRASTLQAPAGLAKAGDLAYALTLASAQIEGSPRSDAIAFEGHLRNLTDSGGGFSFARALLDVQGQVPSLPTTIPDTLAQQNGLLVDALGDSVRLALNVAGFPLGDDKAAGKGGSLSATFTSPRASAELRGDIGESVLVFNQPVEARLLEITTGLSGRLVKGLPLVGSFQKNPGDAPASLRGEGLIVPLDKDYSKLNGVLTIDPGEAQFATSGLFNQLLNLAKLREAGQIGRRLGPLTITVQKGVATYPRWGLPLGEFTVQTEGKVDLVRRELDIITWIPAGALADNTIGLFGGKNLLGGTVLEAASLLPFRTKGSLDNPSTAPDLALFAETTVKNLNPVDVIRGIGDLFKKPATPPPPP
jgi:hypothetical protein